MKRRIMIGGLGSNGRWRSHQVLILRSRRAETAVRVLTRNWRERFPGEINVVLIPLTMLVRLLLNLSLKNILFMGKNITQLDEVSVQRAAIRTTRQAHLRARWPL